MNKSDIKCYTIIETSDNNFNITTENVNNNIVLSRLLFEFDVEMFDCSLDVSRCVVNSILEKGIVFCDTPYCHERIILIKNFDKKTKFDYINLCKLKETYSIKKYITDCANYINEHHNKIKYIIDESFEDFNEMIMDEERDYNNILYEFNENVC